MSDKGIEGVKARLEEQRDEIKRLEQLLAGAGWRRAALIEKLGEAGLSERAIAPLAGVSNVTVHNIRSAWPFRPGTHRGERRGTVRAKLGKLDIEAGGMAHRRLGVWIPDGLHIWLGRYGVHLFWSRSPHMPRITFDREERADAR